MSAQHTPGPFSVAQDFDGGIAVADVVRLPSREHAEANARLIAAAPETAAERDQLRALNADLLAALRGITSRHVEMVNSGDCGHWNPEAEPHVIAARAAIARAEGK
jgi:hypothetical protein